MRELPAGYHQDEFGLLMTLSLGPGDCDGEWSEAQLRRGWQVYGSSVMDRNWRAGHRPWGWWTFELGEPMPLAEEGFDDLGEARRLAELGLLEAWELGELRERAVEAELRIAAGEEQFFWPKGSGSKCRDAVELWERVQEAL